MANDSPAVASETVRSVVSPTDLMHLFVLNAMVIAQPLLDRLRNNSRFLLIESLDVVDVCLGIAVLMLAVPGLMTVVLLLCRYVFPRQSLLLHHVFVALFFAMAAGLSANWMSTVLSLRWLGIPAMLTAFVLWAACIPLIRWYAARGKLYSAVSWCIIAVGVVPLHFWLSPSIRGTLLPEPKDALQKPQAENPVPVILIVFDGFPGMLLCKDDCEIDGDLFPAFQRLAQQSTWYRNASTVHYRTDNAVPAILTGLYPDIRKFPVAADHPHNLFQILYDSEQFQMTVFEPVTRLCPKELANQTQPRSRAQRLERMLHTFLCVLTKTTVPESQLTEEFSIPRSWFGIVPVPDDLFVQEQGLINWPWNHEREEQFRHFIQTIRPADRTPFRFLHVVLPHDPWIYLPSGHHYDDIMDVDLAPFGAHGDIGEDWGPDQLCANIGMQRQLLQLQAVDMWLGQMLDRLEATGEADRSLLIVTGDHGMAFTAGRGRREPSSETVAEIYSVPLFIRLPGQNDGITSDANVETIDILPTIAEVIDLQLKEPVDGFSLLHDEPPRLRKTMTGPGGTLYLDSDFPQRFAAIERCRGVFDNPDPKQRLWDLNESPELIGKSIGELSVVADQTIPCRLLRGSGTGSSGTDAVIRCFVEGDLPDIPVAEHSSVGGTEEIAIALNGSIAAVTRTTTDPQLAGRFAAMIPESLYSRDQNELAIFVVRRDTRGQPRLIRCELFE
ncbi:MAG: sulfatase-like hydrolase/transferase [Planctomycetaceae bacterium]|nr:sulfatase-like hydrolase/transferase [Planctomycetaceae bacterium]